MQRIYAGIQNGHHASRAVKALSPRLVCADEGNTFGKRGLEEMISVHSRGHWTQDGKDVGATFNSDEWNGAVFTYHAVRATNEGASHRLLRATDGMSLPCNSVRVRKKLI
jgi:hypothetical protein